MDALDGWAELKVKADHYKNFREPQAIHIVKVKPLLYSENNLVDVLARFVVVSASSRCLILCPPAAWAASGSCGLSSATTLVSGVRVKAGSWSGLSFVILQMEDGVNVASSSRWHRGQVLLYFLSFFVSAECLGVKTTPEQNFVLNEKDKILIYDVRVISPLSYVFKPLRKWSTWLRKETCVTQSINTSIDCFCDISLTMFPLEFTDVRLVCLSWCLYFANRKEELFAGIACLFCYLVLFYLKKRFRVCL